MRGIPKQQQESQFFEDLKDMFVVFLLGTMPLWILLLVKILI